MFVDTGSKDWSSGATAVVRKAGGAITLGEIKADPKSVRSMVVKVLSRLRVLPEYSLQGRLPRHEYCSHRPITPRVVSA
ncbi:hypothetical protein Hanom_Chr09g00801081 [Helianthus anomalus]